MTALIVVLSLGAVTTALVSAYYARRANQDRKETDAIRREMGGWR